MDPQIARLFTAWKWEDPGARRSAAITPKHLRFLHLAAAQSGSALLSALATLLTGAFFFAMRSCEYLRVPVRGRTKILCLGNIAFSSASCSELRYDAADAANEIHFVSIRFEDQKSGRKNETRTHKRTLDPLLCPVRCWLSIVQRVRSYHKSDDSTPVNVFINPKEDLGHQRQVFSQAAANNFLRSTCRSQPSNHFGYQDKQIGTHSIRSGAAMALFMADEHPSRIMILGRWSSDAYLLYIRPQVQEWTATMSKSMLTFDDYHMAPNAVGAPPAARNNNRVHPDDPVLPGDPRRASTNGAASKVSFHGPEPPGHTFSRFHIHH